MDLDQAPPPGDPYWQCRDHPGADFDCDICESNEDAAAGRPAVCTQTVSSWNVLTRTWSDRQCGRVDCPEHPGG